jgi:hypothetical protein
MFAGQVSCGASASFTVTVNEQVAVLFDASVTVQSTVVVPFGNTEPDAGAQTVVAPGQLSFMVGLKVTTAEQLPGSVLTVMLAGHVIVGGILSTTVTVNEQLAVLPAASLAVQVTVVVPMAKAAPLAGAQTAAPTPGQLSVGVGIA